MITPLLLCVALQAPAPEEKASVAVMGLLAGQNVTPALAALLTENVGVSLRNSNRFDRVVSTADVETVLSLEARRQLTSCDSNTCIAEVAGLLGVTQLVTGTVAHVGEVYVFNLRLVRTQDAQTLAGVSRTMEGDSEAVLVRAVDDLVAELLRRADGEPAPAAVTPEPPAPAAASPERAAAPAPRTGVVKPVLRGLAAAGVVAAGVGVLVVVAGLGAAAGSLGAVRVPGSDHWVTALQAGFTVGLGASVLGVLLTVTGVITAGALLGVSLVGG
ncbi:MAG: hypothetical protein HY904_16175 [Deltaproteobacteria bacterium]|nr:hypothetical protein [Deltaproteobacteria bacterium]